MGIYKNEKFDAECVLPEKNTFIYQMGIAFSLLLGGLASGIDKIMVSTISISSTFAIYSAGAIEFPFISILTGAATTLIVRQIASTENNGNATQSFHNISIINLAVLIPLAVFSVTNAQNIMVLVFGDKYLLSAIPFALYSLLIPLRAYSFSSLIISFGGGKELFIRSILFLIFNAVFTYMLIKYVNIYLAPVSLVVLNYIIMLPMSLAMLRKYSSITLNRRKTIMAITKYGSISLVISLPSLFFMKNDINKLKTDDASIV
jgi:O-antigen/teichoic acid export membrane protein